MLVAPFASNLISEARQRLNLTQAEVYRACRLSRSRFSDLERGYRVPSIEEQARLSEVLKIRLSLLEASVPKGARPNHKKLRDKFNRPNLYLAVRDRPNEIRWYALKKRHPRLLRLLLGKLLKRDDLDWIRVYLREALFDSQLEMLFSMLLLSQGAVPGWVSPQMVGFDIYPVIDPKTKKVVGHRRHPTLRWKNMLLFPQLAIRARRLTVRTDMMMGMKARSKVAWTNIELDGLGHDHHLDNLRELELGLPTIRYSESDIVSGEFIFHLGALDTSESSLVTVGSRLPQVKKASGSNTPGPY